ncbi:MAG: alpha/beta hydrolase [Parvibaculaceae bacterium]
MDDPVAPEGRYGVLEEEGIRQFMLETDRLYPPDAVNFSMAEQRGFYDSLCRHFRKPRPPGIAVEDRHAGGPGGPVPVRIYRPAGGAGRPTMLYLHGGGYVVGGLDSHDDICAEIAKGAGIDVVAVDYRLAPEHRFPAAFEDAWAALEALARGDLGLNAGRLVVAGDSAGGNLTAGLCLRARDLGAPVIGGQILIYPGLGGDRTRGSYVQHASAPGLTTADTQYYKTVYIGPPNHPNHASKFAYPLKETAYAGLPPAFLVAAEWDPLRDDCYDYAARLKAAGVEAEVRHEPLLVHAFLRARNMSPAAAASFRAIVAAARSLAHDGRLPPERP